MSAPKEAAARPSHFDYPAEDVVLEVRGLVKHYPLKRHGVVSADGSKPAIKAVDGVSFQLRKGEILGLVGESGCGKTTTGKLLMRLVEPTAGEIAFEGETSVRADGPKPSKEEDAAYRRKVQMIFQDPYASMNPRFKIRQVLSEPLEIHGIGESRAERDDMVSAVMAKVKMVPAEEYMDRHPHMLSGGQRQRIATARTLILAPKVIIADEPVSMIDLSTRAEILHMMRSVQREMELSFLYITHDLSTARYFADRIAVMYLGVVVEIGPADSIIDDPRHPYTQALIAAVCEPESGKANLRKDLPIKGEIPSAAAVPAGCRFHPRCPKAMDVCRKASPELAKAGAEHYCACWLASTEDERKAALGAAGN